MAKTYTYPRVAISATARQHSSVQPPVADTTVMFVPLVTEKGPHKEVVSVHSLSEFISTFGNLSYEKNGQMALNVYNWLRNGGTCYVYRMAGYEDKGQKKAVISTNDNSIWQATTTVVSTDADGNDIVVDRNFLIDELGKEITTPTYFVDIVKQRKVIFVEADDATTSGSDHIIFSAAPSSFKINEVSKSNYYFTSNGKIVDGKVVPTTETKSTNIDVKNCLFVVKADDVATTAAQALYYTGKKTADDVVLPVGEAKYFGQYYNDLSITVKILAHSRNEEGEIDNVTFNLTVFETTQISSTQFATTAVESFPRRNLKNYKTSLVNSDFIAVGFDIDADLLRAVEENVTEFKYYFKDADDGDLVTDLDALPIFWADDKAGPAIVLGNPTETPIDIMFDAGYPMDIKNSMMNFINNVNNGVGEGRPDIVGIFDTYELKTVVKTDSEGNVISKKTGYLETPNLNDWSEFDTFGVATNIAIYDQYFMISDEMFTGQNIFVTPTYFLSKMIAYNDMNYGIQFPTAGIRRGILDDAEAIFVNPTADEKETMFKARINYAEKTPREYAFMCQRTHDNSSEESYTALSFLNNIRVLEKMKKELERIGRSYLFEFNDSITLSQLSGILNKYVMNWIANRTLASGVVTVAKNPWSDEAVDVNLTIKFNGTIEVISVDITIE